MKKALIGKPPQGEENRGRYLIFPSLGSPQGGKIVAPTARGLRMVVTLFEIEMQICTNVTQTNACILNYFVLI